MPRSLLLFLTLLASLVAGCSAGLGEPCGAVQRCPEGLTCTFPAAGEGQPVSGVCDYPLKTEGEPCTVAAECEAALTCSNHFTPGQRYGTCTPRLPDGSACFMARDCQSQHCAGASGSAADGACGPAPQHPASP